MTRTHRYFKYCPASDPDSYHLLVHNVVTDAVEIGWCTDEAHRFRGENGRGSMKEISQRQAVALFDGAAAVRGDSWEIARIRSAAQLLNKHGSHAWQALAAVAA